MCASAAWAQPARADGPAPAPGVFYEVFGSFSPFSPECVDDPDGNTRTGTAMIVFHCHSAGNQLWRFEPSRLFATAGTCEIANRDDGQCLFGQSLSEPVFQEPCDIFDGNEDWQVQFEFFKTVPVYIIQEDNDPRRCLGVGSFNDTSPLLTLPCDAGDGDDLWSLG